MWRDIGQRHVSQVSRCSVDGCQVGGWMDGWSPSLRMVTKPQTSLPRASGIVSLSALPFSCVAWEQFSSCDHILMSARVGLAVNENHPWHCHIMRSRVLLDTPGREEVLTFQRKCDFLTTAWPPLDGWYLMIPNYTPCFHGNQSGIPAPRAQPFPGAAPPANP